MRLGCAYLRWLLAISIQLSCLAAWAQTPVPVNTLNEQTTELQQLRLESFKALQEKDAEALRTQLAAVDKRVDDLYTHVGQGSDRLGVYASILGVLITGLLAVLGLLGYFSATQKAKSEAQEAARLWFEDKAAGLEKRFQEIELKASLAQQQMEQSAQDVRMHGEGVKKQHDMVLAQSLANLQKSVEQSLSSHSSKENPVDLAIVQDRAEELKKSPEYSYSFDDWNTRAHAAYALNKLEDAAFFWLQASLIPNADAVNIARVLFNRGVTQGQLGQREAEIATYEEMLRRFGDASLPALREKVAMVLLNKAVIQGQLESNEAEIATYDKLIRRFGDASEPELREQVAKAMINKGNSQSRQGQSEFAIATYNELLCRFGDASEPVLRESVAMAHNGIGFQKLCDAKSLWLLEQDQGRSLLEDALIQFEQALARMDLVRLNGIIMGNHAYALALLGCIEEATKVYAEALQAPVDGGKTLYDGTLSDFEIHPIPEDQIMRKIIERQWKIWQDEQGSSTLPRSI